MSSGRMRVYELSRELGMSNAELLELLRAEGVEVKSHASMIDEDEAELIREHVLAERKAESSEETEGPVGAAAILEAMEAAEEEDEEEGEEEENTIHLKPPVIVRDLAEALGRKPNEVISQLMMMGVFAAINQVVEVEHIEKVCANYGFKFVRERRSKAKVKKQPGKDARTGVVKKKGAGQQPRPPVVTFLGHVDHGKTSLQDAVRETSVTDTEAGGITQHIGASVVEFDDKQITFLDTPGHEAFTAMRARGANATDIAVVVVAADDGVMPQTIEAINHARAAGVPIVVAMNKIDLPSANPDKVLLGLQQNNVQSEDWGGDVGVVRVSAITQEGLDNLLERVLLEAEMLELKCDPDAPAEALVIEAQLEAGRGPTANILVRDGTLHVGDVLLCGHHYGRVKALIDDQGDHVKSVGPSCPAKVLGLSGVPDAGAKVEVLADEREARRIAEERAQELRTGELAVTRQASLEDLFQQIADESVIELPVILKADVQGSIEAIIDSLNKIDSEKIRLKVIHQAVGEITENDVLLAAASRAIIVGFHVRVMPGVRRRAKDSGVEVRLYSIIYELLDDIQAAMRGRLEPESREVYLGKAEILKIFDLSSGRICGCGVLEGVIRASAEARVIREGELIFQGSIQSLKHYQDDVREMRAGTECGIRLTNFTEFEVGDMVECYEIQKVAAEL